VSKPTRPPIVVIAWRDCETAAEWMTIPDLLEFANMPRIIYTTGFLIEDNCERYVLASSWETTFGKIAGGWIIPKQQVISVMRVVATIDTAEVSK